MKILTRLLIIISSIICVFGFVALSLHFSPYVNSIFAKNYLVEKYNVKRSEIHFVEGRAPTIIWHNNGNIIGDPERLEMSIKYKMNDKEFFVQRFEDGFFDDYQIYDLEKLGTEWLQKNTDESIKAFALESKIIYGFQKISEHNRLMLFSEENIEEFLEYYFSIEDKDLLTMVYFYNSPDDYYHDLITEKIQSRFELGTNLNYVYCEDISIAYEIQNDNDWYWEITTIN